MTNPRRFQLLLAALVALTLAGPVASAHAWGPPQAGSFGDPAPNQHLESAPTQLVIRFTENVEREYTRGEVRDLNGTRVDLREVRFSDTARNEITVPLGPMGDGVYTVNWYSLSVDTHTAQGSYLFAVGNASLEGQPGPTVSHEHGEGHIPIWIEGGGRALHYVALAVTIGLPAFLLLIARQPTTPNLQRLRSALPIVLGAGVVGGLVVLYAFDERLGLGLTATLASRVGMFLALRAALIFVSLVASLLLVSRGRTDEAARRFLVVMLLAGAGALVFTSLSSHAAAVAERPLNAIAADMLHIAAASTWAGGVVAFLATASLQPAETLAKWIRRFSPIAITCVLVLVGTGLFASLMHLERVSDLLTSAYGATLLTKILLLGPLVALGAYHRYRAAPNLAAAEPNPARLRRSLTIEVAIMSAVLLAAGLLATTPPPTAAADEGSGAAKFDKALDTAHLIFEITPAPLRPGIHNYTVQLHSFEGENPPGTEVFLKIAKADATEPDSQQTMTRQGPSTWNLQGAYLTSRGDWNVWVVVQRPDEYAKNKFTVTVE